MRSQQIPSGKLHPDWGRVDVGNGLPIGPVRYRALGPITVEVDGLASKLGGLRQQMVLAVLLSRANQVVPQDTLIDAVWSGRPPEAARATLQSYIYNLRRSVTNDVILRRGDGYLIEADATNFDVLDFAFKLQNGLDLLSTDPATSRKELIEGLSLWFGSPYGGSIISSSTLRSNA